MTKGSISYDGTRYEISIPWKKDPGKINPSGKTVVAKSKCMHSIWGNYQHVYKEGVGPTVEIYLAYFPIPRTDKDTAKKQLVSDESAKKALIYLGPKGQKYLYDVLIRFRRNSVAVVCDISEMYLQIKVNPTDCHRTRDSSRDI